MFLFNTNWQLVVILGSLSLLGILVPNVTGEPGPGPIDPLTGLEDHEEVDPTKEDVASVLINTLYTSATPPGKGSAGNNGNDNHFLNVPELEMKKLKAASKGAGLTDAKAERVLRAVRALDLKYHEVLDLKKVMINPSTSADYADRVRRALEDAVVDKHVKLEHEKESNATHGTHANKGQQTMAIKSDDANDSLGRRDAQNNPSIPNGNPAINKVAVAPTLPFPAGQPQGPVPVAVAVPVAVPVAVGGVRPEVPLQIQGLTGVSSGPQAFFGTPLTAQALPEDLDNLWILSSHLLTRKEAFQLVQLCYLLKISRSEVFDLQHEFASGAMTKARAILLTQELGKRLALETPGFKPPVGSQVQGASSSLPSQNVDLSKPLDTATLKRLQTVAELSGVDKTNSARLVRAVMNSGLEPEQVHQIGEVIQNTAASPEDVGKLIDHLEETDLHSWRLKRNLDQENFDDSNYNYTPEQAQGADWLFHDQ